MKAFNLFVLCMVLVLVGVFAAICIMAYESDDELAVQYGAWCKVYSVTNITYGEWYALRKANLLPGQKTQRDVSHALATGVILGNSFRK